MTSTTRTHHVYQPAVNRLRRSPATAIASLGALAVIGLEAWDALSISRPEGALLAIVLFLGGGVWLLVRGGRAPAAFLAVLFALELVLNFTIFGVVGDLQHQGSWTDFATGLAYTVANLAGLSATLVLAATNKDVA